MMVISKTLWVKNLGYKLIQVSQKNINMFGSIKISSGDTDIICISDIILIERNILRLFVLHLVKLYHVLLLKVLLMMYFSVWGYNPLMKRWTGVRLD